MTMDCHHCGNFGHKKYECTSKCRVGCKWCDKPPSRRQITNRNSIEVQRQHSTVNIQRTQGSTSINNGQLSLPQQFSQSTNDVRFAYNGTQGHLQQNVTGNVGNVGNVQQQVPNNIQQLSANLGNLGNLGNLQHHINSNITSNMQNVQVNGTNIQNMNQPTNINNVLFDPTIRPLLQKVLESALLQHHHQQQQQQQHQQQQQQAQVQAQAQHINNTNIYGLQSSNQQQPQLLNTDYLQRLQPSQYLMQQLQQLLNLSANVNNSNVNVNNTNINNNVNNNLANVNVNNSNPNNPNLNIVNNSNVNDSQAASTLVSHITTTIPSPKPPQSLQLSQPHQTSQPQTPQLHPLQLQPPQLQTPQLQPSQLQTQQVQPPHLQTPQVQPPQLQTQQVQLPPQVKQSQLLPPPQLHPPQLQLPQPPQPQLTQIPPQLPQLPQLPHPPPPQQPLQPQQPQLPQPFMPTVPTWNNSQVHVQESQQNLQSNEVIMSSSVIPTTTAITSIKKEEGSDSHMVIERQKTLYQEERSHQGEKTHQKSHQEEKTHREDKTNQEDKFHQEEKTSEQQARNIGETNVEILTKLKELKDKIEKGLHPTIKPKVYNQQIADEERFQIQKETERDSRQNNNRYKENGRQNYFSRGTRGRSPAIEHRSPTNYHRSRRSRSPYRYDKESIISDYRRYPRNRSRSTSLRRDVRGPNEYSARSVSPGRFRIEYDERYFRNSGQDKYIPRGMSMSIYEDPRYGGYGERYEDRSRSFGRSRSPGCRRQNSWYGEQYERERFGYDFRDPEFSARRRPTNRW